MPYRHRPCSACHGPVSYTHLDVYKRQEGKELPDRVFEEAGSLAAWYSKGRSNEKVEIDYIQRKHVKKAAGGAPGFVIYHTNYSLMASPKLELPEVNS